MEPLRLLSKRMAERSFASPLRINHRPFRNQPTFRSRPASQPRQYSTTRTSHRTIASKHRFSARSWTPNFRGFATAAEGEGKLSLSQRLRKLSREYGWSALGVYLLLSAADFPFCFLAVRMLGTDRIGHWEHVIVSKIKDTVSWPFGTETRAKIDGAVADVEGVVVQKVPLAAAQSEGPGKRILEEEDTYVVTDHGYRAAEAANKRADASIWTQLALAYAIHKSFIFIRVPLTAAVTPKVVKTLRSWGWNIGKRPTKTVASPTSGPASGGSGIGVNTKGSGVKSD